MRLDDEYESEDVDQVYTPSTWKKPLLIIGALFILLIMVISVVPWYSIKSNPPPDQDVLASFELSDAEKASLSEVEYEATESIQLAIEQVDVFNYRIITNRLVSSACLTHSNLCYTKAIYYYVQDMQYVSDPASRQYVQSPAETLLSGAGDCEDMALLYSAMAESIGIDSDIGTTGTHAFVRVQASSSLWGDDYTWLDPTSNNEFGEVRLASKDVLGWHEVA